MLIQICCGSFALAIRDAGASLTAFPRRSVIGSTGPKPAIQRQTQLRLFWVAVISSLVLLCYQTRKLISSRPSPFTSLTQFSLQKINNLRKRNFLVCFSRSGLVFNRAGIQAAIADHDTVRDADQFHVGKHKTGADFPVIE